MTNDPNTPIPSPRDCAVFNFREFGRLIRAIDLLSSWGLLTEREADSKLNMISFCVIRPKDDPQVQIMNMKGKQRA